MKVALNRVKQEFWGNKEVILHSRNIRKCDKEFAILLDYDVKARFYKEMNEVIQNSNYEIIAAGIDKREHVKRYGTLARNPYEIALSYIYERAIFCMDEKPGLNKVQVLLECRGNKEDKELEAYIHKLLKLGTYYVSHDRFAHYGMKAFFEKKSKNINGMQVADLFAYPIARYILEPNRANPAFDILKSKIYSKSEKRYGLKVFP